MTAWCFLVQHGNTIGLVFDIVGAFLLALFGLQPVVNRGGAIFMGQTRRVGTDRAGARKAERYERLGTSGCASSSSASCASSSRVSRRGAHDDRRDLLLKGLGTNPMRAFAWCCVVAGLVLAIGWGSYAYFESERRYAAWWKRDGLSVDFSTWTRAAAMRDAGERPEWTVVEPWPGVIAGAGVTALGIIVLAIRRPERP